MPEAKETRSKSANLQIEKEHLSDLSFRRLSQQLLLSHSNQLDSPSTVVERFGAVQAQDYAGAKWALGLRMRKHTTDASIELAFNEGPTWHFVHPKDIRWLVDLTAPRVNVANSFMYRQLGLDEEQFSRSNKIIEKALIVKHYLTRAELSKVLEDAGMKAKALRLVYFIMRAELEGLICSGPRRGKQFTYALLDERAPHSRILDRKEALEELTMRYFTSHGPATLHDFAWWSGLNMADAREGLEETGSRLDHEILDGKTYWFRNSRKQQVIETSKKVLLLPTFDEFLVGYSSYGRLLRGRDEHKEKRVLFNSPIVSSGKVMGTWKREFKKDAVKVTFAPFSNLDNDESEALIAAADHYSEFMGMPVMSSFFSG